MNHKLRSAIIAVLFVLSFCVLLLFRSGALDKEPVVKAVAQNCYADTLHVITDEDYRPYSFYDSKGNFSGHDVEVVTMLANRMHMNLDLRFMPWKEAIDSTISGNGQVLMTCDFSDTFTGSEKYLKTVPISTDEFTVYSKKKINSVNELYSKRIGIMNEGNVMPQINMLLLQDRCSNYSDNRHAMIALMNDEVDCAIMRNAVGAVLLKELNARGIKGYITIGQSYMCFGVNDNYPELTNQINEALDQMKVSGELQALSDKWLTTFIEPYSLLETISRSFWLVVGFFILLGVLIVVIYRSDKRELKEKEDRSRYMMIVENLANDFECVNYVPLSSDKKEDSATLIRISDDLNRNIPQWATEHNFSRRLDYMCEGIVAPEDREMFLEATRRETVMKRVSEEDAYFVNFKAVIDGEPQFFQLKFSGVYSQEGELTGFVFGVHNIDAQTKAEMFAKQQLEAANKSKTDFLFNMSHDIRTPMNAIIGFTDIAKKYIDDKERVLDCLGKIETSGGHLLELINEVLDMSRVEAGKLKSDMKVVNVIDASRRLITICQETATARNINLSFRHENIQNQTVLADELHITQILMNILGNAIKFTMPGGFVSLSVSELESDNPGYGQYKFAIQDNGIGMSKEFQEKIFESFSREENNTVNNIQGTGLGMSIVKRLVDYMDGSIDIQSERGLGTTVTVTIHLKIAGDAQNTYDQQNASEGILDGKKVLLVEDNELNREITTYLLEENGMVVEEAVNGLEAVERIKTKGADYYDCVLMDIQMPLMNGYQATAKIRELPGTESLVIIALSANAFEEDRRQSIQAGMNDHLPKPINPAQLTETLEKYL